MQVNRRQSVTPDEERKIVRVLQDPEEISVATIARRFGRAHSTIVEICRKYGIERKDRSGRSIVVEK